MSRILIVDDDERSRRLARDVLDFHGYEVETCASGEAALERLALRAPALVLLDIQLPGLSGLEVLAWLRARPELAAVRAVAMTASVMPGDLGKLRQAGFDGVCPKPLSLQALLETAASHAGPPGARA